jgi:hypothetical protein
MTTNITTTTETTTVVVEENIVRIELNNVGVQGTPGLSGVVSVVSPITNVGSAGSAIVGINQALLSITKSQVSDFTSGTVTSASTAQQAGTAVYAVNSGTAVYATNAGTAVYANAAEQTLYLVRNNTGTTILKGTLLAASGAEPSGRIDVEPFVVTGLQDSELRVMGVATANIGNGVNGTVMSFGTLVGVDTRGNVASALAVGDETWAEGDILFAHPTVPGKLTNVRPQHDLDVAFITVRHASTGQIAIRIVPGNFHLEWLHDVSITSPTNNQVLTYDSASSLWVNANNAADGVTSITATAPLTGGTITSTGSIGLDQTALSITRSQVSDFTSGTVAQATNATTAGTATYATTSGTAVFATTSGTAVFATNSGTAVNISGTVTQSQVTNLTSDLALKAPLASPTFSGTVTFPFTNSGIVHSGTAGVMQVSAAAPGLGYIPYTAPVTGSYSWLDLGVVAREDQANTFTVGPQTINTGGTANKGLVVIGAASQSANLFEVQTSSSTAVRINQVGNTTFSGNISSNNNATFTPASTATVPLTVRGASGQSVDLLQIQNDSSAVLGGFGNTGNLRVRTTIEFSGALNVAAASSTQIGAVIRGAASQSANIQEWQNSGGTALASISNSGGLSALFMQTEFGLAQLANQNSGGGLRLNTAGTAINAAPGASRALIYVKTGTNANTLKLVVRAGTAGAETTILDNIPTA